MVIEPKLLSFQKVLADSVLANILKVREGDPLIMIDNLRIINGHPAMYDRIWLPQKKFLKLTQKSFESRSGSIYSLYQSQFMMTIVRIHEQVEAIKTPGFVMQGLGLKKSEPVLKISRYAYTYGDDIVEYRNRYVNTAYSLYMNEIGLKE